MGRATRRTSLRTLPAFQHDRSEEGQGGGWGHGPLRVNKASPGGYSTRTARTTQNSPRGTHGLLAVHCHGGHRAWLAPPPSRLGWGGFRDDPCFDWACDRREHNREALSARFDRSSRRPETAAATRARKPTRKHTPDQKNELPLPSRQTLEPFPASRVSGQYTHLLGEKHVR